jgi:hypothetical protein
MSAAPEAEAALGRSAVVAAMVDPLTAMLRKSLRVFISSSSLLVSVSGYPEVVRQIDDDRLWSTSHDHPSK